MLLRDFVLEGERGFFAFERFTYRPMIIPSGLPVTGLLNAQKLGLLLPNSYFLFS